jgi:hypothetical protein
MMHELRSAEVDGARAGARNRAGGVFRHLASQPRWALRAVLAGFLVVMAMIIAVPVLVALMGGIVLLVVLALGQGVVGRINRGLPRRDGRENVRVMQPVEAERRAY